jgi:hypothetical protein
MLSPVAGTTGLFYAQNPAFLLVKNTFGKFDEK